MGRVGQTSSHAIFRFEEFNASRAATTKPGPQAKHPGDSWTTIPSTTSSNDMSILRAMRPHSRISGAISATTTSALAQSRSSSVWHSCEALKKAKAANTGLISLRGSSEDEVGSSR